MKHPLIFILLFSLTLNLNAGKQVPSPVVPGYEQRIRKYVDSLRVIDTHEHLFTPEIINGSFFLDFMLLFQQNGYYDLLSAGMPGNLFDTLFNTPLTPLQKWSFIDPYWKKAFNTTTSRVMLLAAKNLYGIDGLDKSSVTLLSKKIEEAWSTDWFDRILRDSCKIDYVIQDGYYQSGKDDYFRYAKRFDDWILIRSKYRIDSLAISQLDPIYTLEDLVKSLRHAFEKEVKKGMAAVKIFIAYSRPLSSEKVEADIARKVFRTLVNGNEDKVISFRDAKPLQDYMLYQLLELAGEYEVPVAFHTGLQSGTGNLLENSNPALLTGLIKAFQDVNFVLYHGSYPYGGLLSTMAKTFKNVYIDMNWVYAISPSYSERYLSEWLETVPASKLMAFGGDYMVPENIYGELLIARQVISNVLIRKVKDGYISENEAKTIARMILRDNAASLYHLP
jgi:predicted TIM-barrel fold metal-dependent hydrolase